VYNSDDSIRVIYIDNGVGIVDFEATSGKSLGVTLIHSLLDQIDASFEYDTKDKFKLTFEFPLIQNGGPYQNEDIAAI
jgi:two-component sensor histidine kinase